MGKKEKVKKEVLATANICCDSVNGSYVEVMIPSKGGTSGYHGIQSLQAFAEALHSSTRQSQKKKPVTVRLGRLSECLYDLVLDVNSRGNVSRMVSFFAVKGMKRYFSYRSSDGEKKEIEIPFPNLFFVCSAKNGHTSGMYCYAYKDGLITDKTSLYRYPFGNVNMTGSVCMGGYGLDIDTPMDLRSYMEAFFFMTTNNDSYTHNSNKSGKEQEDFVRELSKLEEFPLDLLSPLEKSKKVKDVIKEIMKDSGM